MLWTFPKNRCRRFRFSTSQVASTKLSHGLFGREEPKGGRRRDEGIWRSLNHRLDLAGYGIKSISTGRRKMRDELPSPTLDTELTTDIVAAYVRRNQIGAD